MLTLLTLRTSFFLLNLLLCFYLVRFDFYFVCGRDFHQEERFPYLFAHKILVYLINKSNYSNELCNQINSSIFYLFLFHIASMIVICIVQNLGLISFTIIVGSNLFMYTWLSCCIKKILLTLVKFLSDDELMLIDDDVKIIQYLSIC